MKNLRTPTAKRLLALLFIASMIPLNARAAGILWHHDINYCTSCSYTTICLSCDMLSYDPAYVSPNGSSECSDCEYRGSETYSIMFTVTQGGSSTSYASTPVNYGQKSGEVCANIIPCKPYTITVFVLEDCGYGPNSKAKLTFSNSQGLSCAAYSGRHLGIFLRCS